MYTLQLIQTVYQQICETIGTRAPDCGGVLGADEKGIITHYYFDESGKSTASSYEPDVEQINHVLLNDWMPQGIYMVGIVHSHANSACVPSCGDIAYGIRILQALDTVTEFYLPIITVDGSIKLYGYILSPDPEHLFICQQIECEIVAE